jgi:hypothetical protein
MKKLYAFLLALTLVVLSQPMKVSAQAGAPVKSAADTLSGVISANRTLTNDKIWFLSGYVYVDTLVTLTIEPGTIIKGIKATSGTLFIQRGGKLIAQGTVTAPIVFTSDQAAGSRARQDWGGIQILGRATVNTPANPANNTAAGEGLIEGLQVALIPGGRLNRNYYGGKSTPIDNDNSGTLQYVRIEYAGIPNPAVSNSETNSLTLGGVGTGTTIDHIMVTEAGDDAFEWFGGTVNSKYLIANGTQDDDWDTDFGFSGSTQFGLSRKVNTIFDTDASNSFESDNNNIPASLFAGSPQTRGNFANMTCIGFSYKLRSQVTAAPANNHQFAARIRRNTRIGIFNSIMSGFGSGLRLDNDSTVFAIKQLGLNGFQFDNNVITQIPAPSGANNGRRISSALLTNATWTAIDSTNWVTARTIAQLDTLEQLGFANPYQRTQTAGPDFSIVGTPTYDVRGKAAWTNGRLAGNTFFDQVTYLGAVDPNSTNPWHVAPWTSWDPQQLPYDTTLSDAKMLTNVTVGDQFGAFATGSGPTNGPRVFKFALPYNFGLTVIRTQTQQSAGASILVNGQPFTQTSLLDFSAGPLTFTVVAANGDTANYLVYVRNYPKAVINSFDFLGLTPSVVGNVVNYTITGTTVTPGTINLTVPSGTNVTNLVASLTIANVVGAPRVGASFSAGVVQSNGVTVNNFTNPVTYWIADSSNAFAYPYTVTVSIGKSSAKDISAFSFASPAATGVITGTNIAVTVPSGTNLTNLVATFTNSPLSSVKVGTTAQVSGTTANNFTSPVTYTVMAEDSTTKDYTVTVSIATAIDPSLNTLQASIYPNPASNVVNFDLFLPSAGETTIELMDVNGRNVATLSSDKLVSGMNTVEMNVSNVSNGIYVARITSAGKSTQTRLLIAR